jgi:hypothetical protein
MQKRHWPIRIRDCKTFRWISANFGILAQPGKPTWAGNITKQNQIRINGIFYQMMRPVGFSPKGIEDFLLMIG